MSSMLRKKEVFTIITPIPGFIPRQLAIDILHSHSEVITLNPLVLDHKPIKAPRTAASDEYYSTWYEITERIQYIPGIGKMGSGKINFTGCFHDMPWGLQTHIYAPMNTDLKNRYRIGGNQPGVEPPETLEMGLAQLGAPSDGLYLRDDIEIKCNVAMASFVKSQMKAASREMVTRIIRKAELLDAGVLHAMIENGKLKTINPNDRTNTIPTPDRLASPRPLQYSPTFPDVRCAEPPPPQPQPYHVARPASYQPFSAARQGHPGGQNPHWSAPYGGIVNHHQQQQQQQQHPAALSLQQHQQQHQQHPQHQQHQPHEQHVVKPSSPPPTRYAELPDGEQPPAAPIEMPGDFSFPQKHHQQQQQPPQPSPTYPPSEYESISGASAPSSRMSPQPGSQMHANGGGGGKDWRWSQGSEASGISSIGGGSGAMNSPGLPPAEPLPTHDERPEHDEHECHQGSAEALRKLDPGSTTWRPRYATPTPTPPPSSQSRSYAYNPADYAKVGRGSPMRSASYGYSR